MSQGIKKLDENVVAAGRSFTITSSSVRDNTNLQIGTLRCYPTDNGLRYKAEQNDYRLFDALNILEEHSIVESRIGSQQISTRTIADLNVTTDKIANKNITRDKIANRAVGSYELDDNSVLTNHIANEQVTTEKIADIAITSEKIKDLAVTEGKIAPDAVLSVNIRNGAVTNNKLLDAAVTNDKIFENTIENSKIKDLTIQGGNETGIGKIAEQTITAFNMADSSITTAKLANGAVTSEKIATATITNINIAPEGIHTNNIENGAITSEKLAESAVVTDKIADGSVTRDKLSQDIFNTIDNAVVYELDDAGNSCVRIKENTYLSVLSGDVNVNGNVTATRVYNMAYSDIAEGYIPGEELEPGDMVYLREDGMVYKEGPCYVGVISDEYAMCLGASDEELENKSKVAVALIGRVHVKLNKDAKLGQRVTDNRGNVIGKALETKYNMDKINNKYQKVLCLLYPN